MTEPLLDMRWQAQYAVAFDGRETMVYAVSPNLEIHTSEPMVFHSEHRPYALRRDEYTSAEVVVTHDVARIVRKRDGLVCARCLFTSADRAPRWVARCA